MQVKPILYTTLIALGFALLANSWVIDSEKSASVDIQTSSISGINAPLVVAPTHVPKWDTVIAKPRQPDPVKYDTSEVSAGIQDLVLEARIKKQLFKNEVLRSENISVKVVKGRVQLDGSVSALEIKRLIEATVERVKGVVDLESNIQLT